MSTLPVHNYPFTKHTTIRLGGICEAYFPETYEEMISLVLTFSQENIPFSILGRMSNVLPPDDIAKTKVIFTDMLNEIQVHSDSISLMCGVRMSRMIYALAKEGKTLAPSLIGVPGSVGGMVVQNASCYGEEIASSFLGCLVYSINQKRFYTLDKNSMDFAYRTSVLKKEHLILMNATFSLKNECALDRIRFVTQKRKMVSPKAPSLGSVFLKHNGISIGYLLDILGQKGRSFGGIAVSEQHAGVLVNRGNGYSEEYKKAVNDLSELIKLNYGFVPVCEVEFLK